MPERTRHHRSERRAIDVRTSRMEAFSDGVFAIAITLLVLDIVVPGAEEKHLSHVLLEQWPVYLAYIVSFASVGAAWLNHNLITDNLERANSILLRLNLLLLLFISFLPFPTHMLANFLNNYHSERIAITVYGINLFAIIGLTSLLWRYAVSAGLISKDLSASDEEALSSKMNPSLVFYAVVIVIGLIFPRIAVFLYLVIALYILLPFRSLARHFKS